MDILQNSKVRDIRERLDNLELLILILEHFLVKMGAEECITNDRL